MRVVVSVKEDDIQTVTVTVVGVDVPDTTGNTYHYCENDPAMPLIAKEKKDESKSFYANGFVWSVDGGASTTTTPVVSTTITGGESVEYEYKVYQTYEIPSPSGSGVCKGDSLTWKVKVTYVPPVKTSQVTYMKAKAVNGTFDKNVMEQSENKAIMDYTSAMNLWWYEQDCTTLIGTGKTAPTPTVDPSIGAGKDQDVYYCVRQEVEGCKSEGTELHVVISDAPKPIAVTYAYCRGEVSTEMTTEPDQTINPTATYVLKWYGNGEKDDMTDLNLSGANGPAPKTTLRASEKPFGYSVYYYYVTQTEIDATTGKEGAESNPTEIVVTVYDQPQIKIDESKLATVCKPQTIDISKSVSVDPVVPALSYDFDYYNDAALSEVMGSTNVTESGSYYVKTSFDISASENNGTCVSDTVIPVTIDTLQVTVENVSTCPNMEATFNVNVGTNAASATTYHWEGLTKSDPKAQIMDPSFTTSAFTGADYGDEFFYALTVTAGECSFFTDTLKVSLGEGPIFGTMTITEDGNTYEPNTFKDTKSNEFYSCGAPVSIKVAYETKEGDPISDYVWYEGTQEKGRGSELILPENREGGDRTYRVEFTSGCPTNVTITIHNRPIEVNALSSQTKKLCEGKEFTTEIETKSYETENPTLTWYLGDNELSLGSGVSLNVTKKVLTIDKVAMKDNGRYKVVMTNRGCTAKADLDSLVAMPYIVATEMIDTIVPRNSNSSIELDVTVPANGTGVEYEWKGTRGENESTNPISLTDVVTDHFYNVTMRA